MAQQQIQREPRAVKTVQPPRSNIPRRQDRTRMTSAELAITESMRDVEDAISEAERIEPGSSKLLKEAMDLLKQARDKVSDHVDSNQQ